MFSQSTVVSAKFGLKQADCGEESLIRNQSMDIREAERIAIAKPLPSRPICSDLGSLSKLIAATENEKICTEAVVAAIRPKTVRFRPMVTAVASATAASLKSGKGVDDSSDHPEKPSFVVYKPKAKLVSKATVSFLANMGSSSPNIRQIQRPTEICAQTVNRGPQLGLNVNQNPSVISEAEQMTQTSRNSASQENPKTPASSLSRDRLSHDGYNWRKYGQKQVKGSEFPRSYYKCTYTNCPVKRKVERSAEGQVTEIVYQGEHVHPKPYPPRHGSVIATKGSGNDRICNTLRINQLNERQEGSEGGVGNVLETRLPPLRLDPQTSSAAPYEPVVLGGMNSAAAAAAATSDSYGPSGECDEGSKTLEREDDEPIRHKRRKSKNQSSEASLSMESSQEPRASAQSSADSEILEDGFRWRKYGQKVVRGNPHPRSYYRCTSPKCGARKHVERASDDPRAFITTYEGKHNHEMPLRSTYPLISQEDS